MATRARRRIVEKKEEQHTDTTKKKSFNDHQRNLSSLGNFSLGSEFFPPSHLNSSIFSWFSNFPKIGVFLLKMCSYHSRSLSRVESIDQRNNPRKKKRSRIFLFFVLLFVFLRFSKFQMEKKKKTRGKLYLFFLSPLPLFVVYQFLKM